MDNELIIRTRLQYDDEFAIMCLLKLYELQEADEQDVHSTHHVNGVGFNKTDAPVLSMYARDCMHTPVPSQFTDPAMEDLHRLLPKYAKQLSLYLTEEEVES